MRLAKASWGRNPLMLGEGVAEKIEAWARGELKVWALDPLPGLDLKQLIESSGPSGASIFVFHLSLTKVVSMWPSRREPCGRDEVVLVRAEYYLALLQRVVSLYPITEMTIPIDVGDGGLEWSASPLFSFQKPASSRNLLLPDIDFLEWDFYKHCARSPRDELTYEQKAPRAVFVGSTTGGGIITAEMLRDNSVPRIRAARFFKADPAVDFFLPNIVQCESDAVKAAILQEELGGYNQDWSAQYRNRFVLSIDGNGATCSRVFLGLRSNSVLVKYDSPHKLFYFRGMRAGVEFLDVSNEADVVDLVSVEQRNPLYFRPVASNGMDFASKYLNTEAVLFYLYALLKNYGELRRQPV